MTPGYEALHHGAAWGDLSGRGKIKVTGEDRARLLHALSTNHIQDLEPGQGCYAFFLSAQGRILADAAVLCRPDHLLLDTEPEIAAKLAQHIDKFIIADDAYVEDCTAQVATIAVEGPQAEAVLLAAGAPIPALPFANLEWNGAIVVRMSYTGGAGFYLAAPVERRAAILSALAAAGATAASEDDFRTVRIEHGKPRYGEDISERFLAQEVNLPHALHFSKGCYLGQEIVERVRSRGQIHRILTSVEIDTETPPPPGTKLTAPSAEGTAAEIASSAFSPERGKTVALAYVRTAQAAPGTPLDFGGIAARVISPAAQVR